MPASSIGAHSMLYLNTSYSAKEAMFAQAADLGASMIRLDIELSGVFVNGISTPDWSGVDEYMTLATKYGLQVLADLTATPYYMVDCPPGTPSNKTYMCPPSSPQAWAQEAALIVAHAKGVIEHFEIINEPDGRWGFLGTAQQYSAILGAACPAIHAANPQAKVILGGIMEQETRGHIYLNKVFGAVNDLDFDIANVHLRGRAQGMGTAVQEWQAYFNRKGFHGPLWITETGYPADARWQTDPPYQNGAQSQADWMAAAIPKMLNNGASRVFVTERDLGTGVYSTEGVLQTPDPLPPSPSVTRRPSFAVVQAIAA